MLANSTGTEILDLINLDVKCTTFLRVFCTKVFQNYQLINVCNSLKFTRIYVLF